MSIDELNNALRSVKEYLETLSNTREHVIKLSRDVLTQCRRLITRCLYGDCNNKYVKSLEEAFNMFKNYAMQHLEIYYSSFYSMVESEYVEAIQFYYIVNEGKIKTVNELNVHPASYVLGLLDVIGELKRYSLELIEKERYDDSLKIFEVAEKIFEEIAELSHIENAIPGLKRRIDVYRKVLDDWRELLIDLLSRVKLRKAIESIKQV
ncbi:hypothetical protein QPL79_06630 [Ignisphaera sp. 4213-co]|uniref:Haloacid dehalogenase n=1 Tax=Ignisphaera cupida TaxID=3050454 RepID=A0ABD4Z6T0_9CREN|nr:hypothetical protein [Ignisphaera sp. 4213-co]MDK6029036.1 hypothetical protein [Ignisphaera sp. 4213-co]